MRKAAIASIVVAAVAIGANWAGTRTLAAAPMGESRIESGCSPGGHVGQTVRTGDEVRVNGKSVSRKYLNKGDWVRTDDSGSADVCFPENRTLCTMGPGSRVRVRPPRNQEALLRVGAGTTGLSCRVNGKVVPKFSVDKHGKYLSIVAPQAAQRLQLQGFDASNEGGNPVFSVSVSNGRAVLKVHRGAGIVASTADPTAAVVVIRNQQAGASVTTAPQQPTTLRPSVWERAAFRRLDRTLPPNKDHLPPRVIFDFPHNPSSVGTARFVFVAPSEPAVFSCALDGAPLHLCTSPVPVTDLAPGCHEFVLNTTDAAGNTATLRYPWTVDGSRIAFESFGPGNPEIFTMTPQGDDLVRVTNDTDPADLHSDEYPTWSPDGKRLAFDREVGGNVDIYVAEAAASATPTRLTTDPADDLNPAWSPDGTKIAFESYRANGNRDIWVMDANGDNPQRLTTDPAEDVDPAWSPDGTKIVFGSNRAGNFDIWVMNADGSNQTQLTTAPESDLGPSWSHDGTRIAYTSRATGNYYNIFWINPSGGQPKPLTTTEANDTNPSWAPDGEHLVFESTRPIADDPTAEMPQLYVLDTKTGSQTLVSPPTTPKNSKPTRANMFAEWGPEQAAGCAPAPSSYVRKVDGSVQTARR